MALTYEQIQSITIPDGKNQLKISDGGGLYLLVKPSGRYWRLAYRFDGKQKSLSLGVYPRMSLAQARLGRDEARALLADKIDPGLLKQQQKAGQESLSTDHQLPVIGTNDAGDRSVVEEPIPVQVQGRQAVVSLDIECRRLHTLQCLAEADDMMLPEELLRQQLITMGHRISSDRLRTDLAWLLEQHVVELDVGPLWKATITPSGLDTLHGYRWTPGINNL